MVEGKALRQCYGKMRSNSLEAAEPRTPQPGQVATIATPMNLVLVCLLAVLIYYRLQPAQISVPKDSPPKVYKRFTSLDLQEFNGVDGKPIYLAVQKKVFDVTPGRNFYGPGGPYENFAGRDASRGLACGSFDEDMLTKDLNGPLDDLEGLGEDELVALRDWKEKFESKYLVVGELVAVNEKTK